MKEIGIGLAIWIVCSLSGPISIWLIMKLVFSTALVQTPPGFKIMELKQLGQLVWLDLWLGSLVIVVASPWIPTWGVVVGLVMATVVCWIVADRKGLTYKGNP